MIRYVQGDATQPQGDGPKIVAHVCNNVGAWGGGFVLALSARWPGPEASYRSWFRTGDNFRLGWVQFVQVAPGLLVANMIAQQGLGRRNGPPIRYEALAECLWQVRAKALGESASVVMPRIGCGLAGGTWDRVGPIVEAELSGIDVTVYDLPGTT